MSCTSARTSCCRALSRDHRDDDSSPAPGRARGGQRRPEQRRGTSNSLPLPCPPSSHLREGTDACAITVGWPCAPVGPRSPTLYRLRPTQAQAIHASSPSGRGRFPEAKMPATEVPCQERREIRLLEREQAKPRGVVSVHAGHDCPITRSGN